MSKPSANSVIRLRGVRHNNLKNFDLDLPLNRLIVITGLSGSGKSSLAFDTLFAEGQRRYIETFSPYARQFFDRMDKPKVDSIEGIPPAIAIEQRNSVRSTRSTVGTMTEICDYMKLLWPHIAQLHCRQCGQLVRKDSPRQIWQTMLSAERGMRNAELLITFDLPLTEKISLEESLGLIAKQGYQRLLLSLSKTAQVNAQRPTLFGGVRSSSAAATSVGSRIVEDSAVSPVSDVSAPEDGRTPVDGSRERGRSPLKAHAKETTAYGPRSDQGLALNEATAPWGNQKAASSQFEIVRIDDAIARLKLLKPSSLTVVQDRIRPAAANRARFVEACEQAYHFGKGKLTIHFSGPDRDVSTFQRFNVSTFRFSNRLHCADCDIEYREPSPALFSFNHPLGACPACRGFGRIIGIDYDLAVPDHAKTLAEGAVKPWLTGHGLESHRDLMKFCKVRKVPTDVPFEKLSRKLQDWVIHGDPDYGKDEGHEWPRAWYGVKGYFRWLESKAYKMHVRVLLSRYRSYTQCPDCAGKRFQPEALLYQLPIANYQFSILNSPALSLADFYQLPIRDALQLIDRIAAKHQPKPSDPMGLVLDEVRSRLGYLVEVGLGYITLDRPTRTLSGGETERVNLTTCLGTRLVNTLYVLDEPSVGLHPRDTGRLIRILEQLRDLGNTVVVVEHEASVIRAADQIVDLGPGHGESGGELVFQGGYREILKSKESLTGQYLAARKRIEIPNRRTILVAADVRRLISFDDAGEKVGKPVSKLTAERAGTSHSPAHSPTGSPTNQKDIQTLVAKVNWLRLEHASLHNLKNLNVEIPLGRFVCVTGVSGSGKTTLVREVLLPALEAKLRSRIADQKASDRMKGENEKDDEDESPSSINSLPHDRGDQPSTTITGWEHIGHVVLVDQSALGKTPRSNPAVYVGAFDEIREFFAQTDAARQRGLNASAFSFNSTQGQCERCRGAGFEKIEMQFLSDVFIRCPDCDGRRYRPHILEVKVGSSRREEAPSSILEVRPRRPKRKGQSLLTSAATREWSIADLLEATVDEVIVFLSSFADSRPAQRAVEKLKLLREVGLGYLRLGQPINTLSGGESQRLKLVSHLAESVAAVYDRRQESVRQQEEDGGHRPPLEQKSTLFLFDEPTTGLHFDDVRVLLKVFQRLVDAGHSVIVIEHNLDVIKCADWVIDLGPEAGDQGGELVAQGTPEDVAACEHSHTGRFLRGVFGESVWENEKRRKGEKGQQSATSPLHLFPSAPLPSIGIHGAREHNLKNLSVAIPRGKFVVVTGVSGSGKSTLAFDLLFAEGQRRFLDSMNAYARQFVEQLSRPDVDLITGIPPTVSIEQRNSRGGGKSTVATVTEIYHFLRLLFARLGTQYCPDCSLPVEAQTRDALGRRLRAEMKKRGDLLLLAPVVKNRKGFHADVAEWASKHGYAEVRADKKIYSTSEPFKLDRFREHDVEIVVGVLEGSIRGSRVKRGGTPRNSLASSRRDEHAGGMRSPATPQHLIDEALQLGHGTLFALDNHAKLTVHSTERSCPKCGRSFEPLDPKNFSYNSSQGWCPKCRGFGELFYLPEDVDRGARADAIEESWWSWQEGKREVCPECEGMRLNPIARAVRLNVLPASRRQKQPKPNRRQDADSTLEAPTIDTFAEASVGQAFELFRRLKVKGHAAVIARDILPEIRERLKFLNEVGLGYLQLGRGVPTLSGGEAQRIRLAAQLGSNLSGVLYILDEPTIGLHARDNEMLLAMLEILKSRGNSLVVVEHDEETMRRADFILDLGPGAGVRGGEVVAAGTLKELLRHEDSITGQYLRAQEAKSYPARGERRPVRLKPRHASGKGRKGERGRSLLRQKLPVTPAPFPLFDSWLTLHNASANNLRNLTVRIPLNRLVVVTGVSGSGKSTLIRECLLPVMETVLKRKKSAVSTFQRFNVSTPPSVTGHESIKAVYEVEQSPIGRTPRSTPATYVGFFDEIRNLFAQLPEARLRGYTSGRFSFNSAQGRCPECEGAGTIKLEMNFLPPAFVRCETCQGLRFSPETLDVEFNGKNVAQVLGLSVAEAIQFFSAFQKIRRPLEALRDTGLDYLHLGQTSPTLSGGEAQRVKLVTHLLTGLKEQLELFDPKQKRNLFILEEPTIGLHMADVRRLVEVLQRLVDAGHSVIVIEHNLDLIAEADWVIDLGPEGGDSGGEIVAEGTPEEVARTKNSHTGRFLRSVLPQRRSGERG